MPSYVVTGSSKGLGYALVKVLASNPLNTVIGLVRDPTVTRARLDADGIFNVHVVAADISDGTAVRNAAEETKRFLGGAGLDVLINNAAYVSVTTALTSLKDFEHNTQTVLEEAQKSFDINVSGVAQTVFAFLPLLREGKMKKIVGISSGMGDIDLINGVNLANAAPYAVSKAALSTMFAKFNAAYQDEELLFFTICPGLVDTAEGNTTLSSDDLSRLQIMNAKFEEYAPGFKAADPITAAESCLSAIARSSLKKGVWGFIS
ncbi:uncharacterized protein TrAtP1_010236 [Trichoderma atroviride]|uniref:uncharacterized protein n=1 Tax=Hypocrea atroviridis TaxID=63577 RepID=UPI00332FF282|nr:hypothetical protein TrAtP1_010236 [Trichoderma atroviride]